jgi:hypothetical protein
MRMMRGDKNNGGDKGDKNGDKPLLPPLPQQPPHLAMGSDGEGDSHQMVDHCP